MAKNYTYSIREEKQEVTPLEGEEQSEATYKYYIKVYENNNDVTSSVSSINGINIEKKGSELVISKEEQEKLNSKVDMTINGKTVSVNKR